MVLSVEHEQKEKKNMSNQKATHAGPQALATQNICLPCNQDV